MEIATFVKEANLAGFIDMDSSCLFLDKFSALDPIIKADITIIKHKHVIFDLIFLNQNEFMNKIRL